MTSKELLTPRFEIIAEYPRCEFEKGNILNRIKNATNDVYHINEHAYVGGLDLIEIEKYPHLFRKLNWWENRDITDMPKRLICKAIPNDTEIMEIEEWDMSIMVGWTNKDKRQCCSLLSFNPQYGYFPVD